MVQIKKSNFEHLFLLVSKSITIQCKKKNKKNYEVVISITNIFCVDRK